MFHAIFEMDYYRNKVEAAYNRILKAAKPQL